MTTAAPPAPPALRPQDPLSALISLPFAILGAVLSPFLSPGPVAPAQPPLLIAVLGLVAREIQRVLFNATPVVRSQQVDITLHNPDDVSAPISFGANDPDGEPLVYTVSARGTVGGPTRGTVTVDQATGTFVYDPDDAMAATGGTDTFTVTVSDAAGAPHLHGLLGLLTFGAWGHTSTATVTVNVIAVNDPPVAVDDTFTTAEDTPLSGNVLDNDHDPDSPILTATLGTPPANGAVAMQTNGAFTYTPKANFNGSDTFTYTVSDGSHYATATATITVTPVDDPVVAVPDTATTSEGTAVSGNVLTNDRAQNPDGPDELLTVIPSGAGDSVHGSIEFNADGSWTYTPARDFFGAVTYTYVVSDQTSTATGTLTITVAPVDDPITAVGDAFTTPEDTALTGNVLTNDRAMNVDGPGEELTATLATAPVHGSLVLNEDGTFTYTPNANFHGTDSFSYTVHDTASTATGYVVITVLAVNDPVAAVDDAFTTAEDTPLTGNVLINDRNENADGQAELLTTVAGTFTTTQGGRVTLTMDGAFSYAPKKDFNGVDTFTYTVSDGTSTATGTVTVTVTPVNDPLIGIPDTRIINEDSPPITGNLLDAIRNVNPDGPDEPLTITNPRTVTNRLGTLTVAANGDYTFTANANQNGVFTAGFTVSDGEFLVSKTMTIVVNPVNDPVVAVPDTITTAEDTPFSGNVLTNENAENVDLGERLTVTDGTFTTAHGSITITADGAYTYTPVKDFNGVDTYSYTVTDGQYSDIGTLTITVTPVNDPPVGVPDTRIMNEDSPSITGNLLDAIRNVNPDGPDEPLTITNPRTVTNRLGTLTVAANGDYTFTANANQNGVFTAGFTVSDGEFLVSKAITIIVTPINDPVVAVPDTATVAEGKTVTGNVLTNDDAANVDVGESLTVTAGTFTTAHGSITIAANGAYTYSSTVGFHGTDTYDYTVTDGQYSATGTLTITVTPNTPPTAPVVDAATLTANAVTGVVSSRATSTDVDNDVLVFSGSTTTDKGKVVVNADGTFTYTPFQAARESAVTQTVTDSFSITASDGRATATTLFTVKIPPVNVVIGTVSVEAGANGVAITPDGTRAYVANQNAGSVSVINLADNTVVSTIPFLGSPIAIAMNPSGTRAYVSDTTGSVTVINTATNRVATTIIMDGVPIGIAVSADGSRVYVANNSRTNFIGVIDATTDTRLPDIATNGPTRGIAVSADGTRLYATLYDTGRVAVVNTASRAVIATIDDVGAGANRIVITRDGTTAYVSNQLANTVTMLDLASNRVVKSIPVPPSPNVLTLDKDDSRLYVTSTTTNFVTIIDTRSGVAFGQIDIGQRSRGIAVSPDGLVLYVSSVPATGTGGMLSIIPIGLRGVDPSTV